MAAERRRKALAAARKAAGHTQESLAAALQIDRSTVIRWEAGDHTPLPYFQPKLARLLGQSQEQLQTLIDDAGKRHNNAASTGHTGHTSVDIDMALHWLDQHAGWPPNTSQRKVMSQLAGWDTRQMRDRNARRARLNRGQIAHALSEYYQDYGQGCGVYGVRCQDRKVATSIVTQSEWLDLACPLTAENDRFILASTAPIDHTVLDDVAAKQAVRRLAEAAALDVRLANAPIYQLLNVDIQRGAAISGTVGLAPFVQYALTMDLLEGELVDAVAGGISTQPGRLPLRDRYLPDLASVLNLSSRLCAGGVLALCAIARPPDPYRGAPDYALLVQERSGLVVNAARQLAVIPKGFHQPLTDFRAEAQIGATLRREMEEELFARGDVDGTVGERRVAAPMHPSRLSEPMRWLMGSDSVRMECTGFGLNLVSGNYEFASLIVIEDELFWSRYGGDIEANWESAGLRLYSSLDRKLINELVSDESWSNEGLFAMLQGLRRLEQIGGERVNLPDIERDLAGCS